MGRYDRAFPALVGSPLTSAVAPATPDWNAILEPYRKPEVWRSTFQLVNTAVPFVLLWALMLWSLQVGYWLTLLLAFPTSMMMMRLFIFQHDCGHGSFFKSRRANGIVGSIIGVVMLIPYSYWRRTHAIHHATSGNLDQRGFGDIDTLTVREYLGMSRSKRIRYRLYRHPLVMLVFGAFYQFVIKHRFPTDTPKNWKQAWLSVWWTNAAIAAVVAVMWLTIGIDRFLLVQLPLTLISGTAGVFMFYVQHQYKDTYWRYREAWDYYAAGLEGSSYFELPRILHWCTGNIGYHHIHHVSSRIPNYHLRRAWEENPELQQVTRLSIPESIKTLWLSLWDEGSKQLVGFRELPAIRARLESELEGGQEIRAPRPEVVPRTWRE